MEGRHWAVESLRGTFFTAAGLKPLPKEWWATFSGLGAENLVVSEGPTGHASALGDVDEGTAVLNVTATPNRIDWNYVIKLTAADGTLSPASEGDGRVKIASFADNILRWLPEALKCSRVALGGAFRFKVATKEDGYKALQDYLPFVDIDPEGSSDFFYRINRPRTMDSIGFPLVINRLSGWTVARFSLQATALIGALPSIPFTSLSAQYCRVEVDVGRSRYAEENRVIRAAGRKM